MSEGNSQNYRQVVAAPWGRAKSEPKFRDIGGGMIEDVRSGQHLKQGAYGKWFPVTRNAQRSERAA